MREFIARIKESWQDNILPRPKPARAATTMLMGLAKRITYTDTRRVSLSRRLLAEKNIVAALKQDAFTEANKILRTQVLQRLQKNKWSTLAITSPGAQEGKTLTAINLAINLAREINYTVLLVDADLRQPSVHSQLGLHAKYGLIDYLRSDMPLSELLIHPTGLSGVVVLPSGKPHHHSAELLNSPKMMHLVHELKTRYPSRIVLFDLPPLLLTADTMAFLPYTDATLLVLEEGKTRVHDAKHAAELLRHSQMIGTVLNKSRAHPTRYYEIAGDARPTKVFDA